MKNTNITIALALRDLKCTSIETREDRVILQKKIFISQRLGLPLGYSFVWGGTGPYSTELMEDAQDILREGFDGVEGNKFKTVYTVIIDSVNSLDGYLNAEFFKIKGSEWYLLLSLIFYFYEHGCENENEISAKIKSVSSFQEFSDEQILHAYTRCFFTKQYINLMFENDLSMLQLPLIKNMKPFNSGIKDYKPLTNEQLYEASIIFGKLIKKVIENA